MTPVRPPRTRKRKKMEELDAKGKFIKMLINTARQAAQSITSKGFTNLKGVSFEKPSEYRLPFDYKTKVEMIKELRLAISIYEEGQQDIKDIRAPLVERLNRLQKEAEEFEEREPETYNGDPALKAELTLILLQELEAVIKINPEYNNALLRAPLISTFSNPDIIQIERAPVTTRIRYRNKTEGTTTVNKYRVRVLADAMAGTLEDYGNAVIAARYALNYGQTQTGKRASKSWKYGVYIPYLMSRTDLSENFKNKIKRGSKMSEENIKNRGSFYIRIVKARLEDLGNRPAYWYLLNYGSVLGKRVTRKEQTLSMTGYQEERIEGRILRRQIDVDKNVKLNPNIKRTTTMPSDKGGTAFPNAKPTYFIEKAEARMTDRLLQKIKERGVSSSNVFKTPVQEFEDAKRQLNSEMARATGRPIFIKYLKELVDLVETLPTTNLLQEGVKLDFKKLPASLQDKGQSLSYLNYTRGQLARIDKLLLDLRQIEEKTRLMIKRRADLRVQINKELETNKKAVKSAFGKGAKVGFSARYLELNDMVGEINQQLDIFKKREVSYLEELNNIIDKTAIENKATIDRLNARAADVLSRVQGLSLQIVNRYDSLVSAIEGTSEQNYLKMISRIRAFSARVLSGDKIPSRLYIGTENKVKLSIRTKRLIQEIEDDLAYLFSDDGTDIMMDIVDSLSKTLKDISNIYKRK